VIEGSYQFTEPKLSSRIKNLVSTERGQKWELFIDRAKHVTEAYKKNPDLPPILQRAKALENVLKKKAIYILPGSLIVGNLAPKPRGSNLYPEYSTEYLKREIFNEKSERLEKLDGKYYYPPDRPADAFAIDESIKPEIRDILDWWDKHGTHAKRLFNTLPREAIIAHDEIKVINIQDYIQGGIDHIAPDYDWLLSNGFGKIVEICEKNLEKLRLSHNPEAFDKKTAYESFAIVCRAAIDYAHRYRDLARKMAASTDDQKRKEELLEIAEICNRVPEKPAQSFHEALQFMYFVHHIVRIEEKGTATTIGRFDQTLKKYYENDIKAGKLTREEALELTENFFVKIYDINDIRSWGCTNYFRGSPQFQNLTIGGIDPDTMQDASNELTYIVLEAVANARLENPSVTFRWHINTPEELKKAVAETIRVGTGFPAVYNDMCYIPAMINRGYELRDACNYCIIGCVEPAPPGLLGGRTGGAWLNFAKILEMTLYGGKDPQTGITLHPNKSGKNLDTYSSFDELWRDFLDQLDYYLHIEVIWENAIDYNLEKYLPEPFTSIVACPTTVLERGKPLRAGGGKYDFTGQQTVGTANVGNSLCTTKSLVFEKKKISGKDLLHSLKTNFEDNSTDPSGQEIKKLCENEPKFGNDIDEVDFITRDALAYVCEKLPQFKNTRYGRGPIGGVMHASTSTVTSNTPFGKVVGALPDGRPAGVPLADGQSPMSGTDKNGPVAAANSLAKLKNILLSDGALWNLKFNVKSLKGENLQKFIRLIDHYFIKCATL
jgi:pyruvate formate-lyase/glycerol dehydratase family glycyl radical enzyme